MSSLHPFKSSRSWPIFVFIFCLAAPPLQASEPILQGLDSFEVEDDQVRSEALEAIQKYLYAQPRKAAALVRRVYNDSQTRWLVPDEFGQKLVFFKGTIYFDSNYRVSFFPSDESNRLNSAKLPARGVRIPAPYLEHDGIRWIFHADGGSQKLLTQLADGDLDFALPLFRGTSKFEANGWKTLAELNTNNKKMSKNQLATVKKMLLDYRPTFRAPNLLKSWDQMSDSINESMTGEEAAHEILKVWRPRSGMFFGTPRKDYAVDFAKARGKDAAAVGISLTPNQIIKSKVNYYVGFENGAVEVSFSGRIACSELLLQATKVPLTK